MSTILHFSLRAIQFLSQQGPKAHKHTTWKHPILVCILHYTITTAMLIPLHDYYIQSFHRQFIRDQQLPDQPRISRQIATFTFLYFVTLLSYRIIQNRQNHIIQKACIYENTWLCNSTLYFGTIGLYTQRPILVTAHLITVSIDQTLWYVDLAGFLIMKKFPIGVAKYLTWPETSFATRITCTHHLWTIPLLMYGCHCDDLYTNMDKEEGGSMYLGGAAFGFSVLVMCLSVGLSRWMTPFYIAYDNAHSPKPRVKREENMTKYLNCNLSHELWRDITFGFLRIQHDDPSTGVYLCRLLWRWQLLNGVILMLLLRPMERWFFL